MPALDGIRVLDFTSLVPGPLATLILAEAGAEVIKVERPGGEEMRHYVPRLGPDSANFALLNRGKQGLTVNLKDPEAVARLVEEIGEFDVLVEQYRPGVMERLGLDYATLSARNPALVYCSISGYGQSGPRAGMAGHDLNYVAEAGLLDQARENGRPPVPPALVADIGGGTYPALTNILLALVQRERTGRGAHLDIAMVDGVFTFLYWALAQSAVGRWPRPGGELITGGSPRYNVYATADRRFVAAAPLEDRFWEAFCDLLDIEGDLRDDSLDPAATKEAVAALIAADPSDVWQRRFAEADCCCCVVRSLEEALADPQFHHRGLFGRTVEAGAEEAVALPVPVAPALRREGAVAKAPPLGPEEHPTAATLRRPHLRSVNSL